MDPISLMVEIIWENTPKSIWTESPMEDYRSLGRTNRGEVGEPFVRRYLKDHGIETENGGRTSPTDLSTKGNRFEVKTASLSPAPPTNPPRPKKSQYSSSASQTDPPPPGKTLPRRPAPTPFATRQASLDRQVPQLPVMEIREFRPSFPNDSLAAGCQHQAPRVHCNHGEPC